MKHTINKDSICPFYRHEDSQVIYCDGVTERSVTHQAFGSKTDAKNYKVSFCRAHWEHCRIAQMLGEAMADGR